MKAKIDKDQNCKCACHDNLLKKTYEHSDICCENMNGYLESKDKGDWREKFDNMFDLDGFGESHAVQDKVKNFISTTLKAEREKWVSEIPKEKPALNLEPGFNITAEYRLGEIRGFNQCLKDFLEIKKILEEI